EPRRGKTSGCGTHRDTRMPRPGAGPPRRKPPRKAGLRRENCTRPRRPVNQGTRRPAVRRSCVHRTRQPGCSDSWPQGDKSQAPSAAGPAAASPRPPPGTSSAAGTQPASTPAADLPGIRLASCSQRASGLTRSRSSPSLFPRQGKTITPQNCLSLGAQYEGTQSLSRLAVRGSRQDNPALLHLRIVFLGNLPVTAFGPEGRRHGLGEPDDTNVRGSGLGVLGRLGNVFAQDDAVLDLVVNAKGLQRLFGSSSVRCIIGIGNGDFLHRGMQQGLLFQFLHNNRGRPWHPEDDMADGVSKLAFLDCSVLLDQPTRIIAVSGE